MGGRATWRRRPVGCLYSPRVNAEFNWWLLIVGLVLGAGLVWLILADSRRRDIDVLEHERATEVRWIAEAMADTGRGLDDDEILEVLRLHHEYLGLGPPADPLDETADPEDERWVSLPTQPATGGSAALHPDRSETREPDVDDEAARLMAHPLPRADGPERRVSER